MNKFILNLIFLGLFIFLLPQTTVAHSGRTDSSGCHTCYTNCELYGLSYGEYHCQNSTNTNTNSYPSTTPSATTTLTSVELTKSCQDKHGQDSYYYENLKRCECLSGYAPDNNSYTLAFQCIEINEYCVAGLGQYAQAKVYQYVATGYADNCRCQKPYVVNSTNTDCATPTITSVTTSFYQRPTATVIIPSVINSYLGNFDRTVYTDRPDPLKIVGAMVKGESDPATYIIDTDGKLRWIKTEGVATRLFGTNWDSYITWFNDSIIYTYQLGDTINE